MAGKRKSLSYKARRRWSLVILCLGLPAYIILAVGLVGMFERPPLLVELAIYIGLGFVWILPFRLVFRGVGKEDPDAPPRD